MPTIPASVSLQGAIDQSADPDGVRMVLTRLGAQRPADLERVGADPDLAAAVVAVAAASRSLARLVVGEPAAIEALADLGRRSDPDWSDPAALAHWKQLELLRIAARDLTGRSSLEAVGDELSALADDVLEGACVIVAREMDAVGLGVIGMGKLGGQELNYSSDIDVIFVGQNAGDAPDRCARRVMQIAGMSFRVDADLRPEGRDGPLVRTVDSFQAYWARWADAWEIQALLKARPVAGDPDIGRELMEAAEHRLWDEALTPQQLERIRTIKARGEREVARRGLARREVKRGWGGIRDIELAVQLLQLVHGRHDVALRSRSTLPAIAELGQAGYVAERDARDLADAYRFLRAVEHRLQLVEEAQVHSVPADGDARYHLARVLGFRDEPSTTALARFDQELSRHQVTVRAIHERIFFRPLLEAFSSGGAHSTMTPEDIEARLAAFGFSDASKTGAALRELTRGITRTSRLMQQVTPLLLDWLAASPNPDLGLLGLRRLAAEPHSRDRMVEVFRESPEAARRLCLLLGTSRRFFDQIRREPTLIATLSNDETERGGDGGALVDRVRTALSWRRDIAHRQAGLYRLAESERFRIGARDVLGLDDVGATGADLSYLAEAVLQGALEALEPPVSLAIVAMGRLGGAELSYASDLDLLLVCDSPGSASAAEAVAEDLLRLLNGVTPAERIFTVDPGLRPEGAQGPLSRSIDAYRSYYERWAATWERQALVRARPVAGDRVLGERFMALTEEFVWERPLDESNEREIRRMKARIERERLPPGDDPQFHLKLGKGSLSDVEWTAQLLQLRTGTRSPGTLTALAALEAAGAIDPEDARCLTESYRFCERTRNRLYLVRGAPGDALPSRADQLARLARSLGTTSTDLRSEYRRVTRRARQVVERVFYGIESASR